ncbi:MAG: beta-ketoacyl-[acyl-carrier-protein] synthase II [Candidatus Zixiibacteriota bacterium]|nr:MAG: beta-ketoacyl-[acyl-carrier-protein] synthase II [candidate division Zixibacteria bacterium]
MKRAVITGIGVLAPLGNTVDELWQNLKAGKSGVSAVERFDASRFDSRIAAQVKGFDPSAYLDKKELRRTDIVQQYVIAADESAIRDSQLNLDTVDKERVAVVTGSGIGGILSFEEQHSILLTKGPSKVSPFFINMMIIDMLSGLISLRYGFKGPNYCTVSACASSAQAIGDALRIIQRGEAEVVVTGGAEAAITEMAFAGFCSARALSTRNDQPEKASRPFDADRDGFVMGEGAAILMLEEEEHAKKRGAKIYADLVGCGMSADAYHLTAPSPDGDGAARSMRAALKDAGLSSEQVGYINTHGTSTPLGDVAETMAIKTVFGGRAGSIAINSSKSMIGHMLGAAGAIETVVTALSLRDGFVHPTINIENQDPQCDLNYMRDGGKAVDIRFALSNSFGFGGHNVTLALGKHVDSSG